MHYQEPVLTRNMRKGTTVLDPKADNTGIVWQAHEDINGGDFQIVPPSVANSASFNKAVQKGVFTVVTQEEADRAFSIQRDSYLAQEKLKEERNKIELDESANEILTTQCLGPTDRGTGNCETTVVVDTDEHPPLCTKHKGLAGQFVSSEDWSSGSKITRWNRVVVAEPEVGRTQ